MFEQAELAVIYMSLMALATLLYATLDGYDLGVGMLLPLNDNDSADTMIASIGPFWDANETWLVLAIGLLLIAFPVAHSLVLKELYIPASIMLIGLILRGVAFDFRAKAPFTHKGHWDKAFKLGSYIAAMSQGYMLGMYVMGFEHNVISYCFALLSALGVTAAYCFIGAAWLVMKTEGALQQRANQWVKKLLWITALGILCVSIANIIIDTEIFERWLTMPFVLFTGTIPLLIGVSFVLIHRSVKQVEQGVLRLQSRPFIYAVIIFILTFVGLAVSYFPYIVPNQLTIWQSVAYADSLNFLFYGAAIVIPTILAYTIFSYRVFWGKVEALKYY